MDETSKSFIKWEKFLKQNPSLTAAYEANPKICAKLLANQEVLEKKTILDVAKKNFKKKRKKKK